MTRRLLYLTQYYATAAQSGGTRHYAHTRRLLNEGYDVTLVTSFVKNSRRVIPPEYQGKRIVSETEGPLRIFKVYAYPNFGSDFTSRMRHYLSFMVHAILAGLRAPACDIVLASSPPLFAALAGYVLSLVKRAAFILEVRDLWPQAAVTMGALRHRPLIFLAELLARFLYARAERIVAVTSGIRSAIIAEGVPPSKIEVITNGVDSDVFRPVPAKDAEALRKQLGWDGKFVAMYVGTLARSDGLETVVRAASLVDEKEKVQFAFLGAGEAKPGLMRLAQELQLTNVTFLDPRPKREVPLYANSADLCILPTRGESFFGMILPNKLFDYLAAGRAVVASVPPGEIRRVLEAAEAGLAVDPADPEALARAVVKLKEAPKRRKLMGENGKRYVFQHYDRRQLADRLAGVVNSVYASRVR